MNLILLNKEEVQEDKTVVLASGDPRAVHIQTILKGSVGKPLKVGIINGGQGYGYITEMRADKSVVLRCEANPDDAPAPPPVDLVLATPRPKVVKRLVGTIATLGVRRIMLTQAAKVEKCFFDSHIMDPGFFPPALIEGLQQARDTYLPSVTIHRNFNNLLAEQLGTLVPEPGVLRVVAHPGKGPYLSECIAQERPSRVVLAIGPEGGWTDDELALLEKNAFHLVQLGPRILKTEMACMGLISIIHHELLRNNLVPLPPLQPWDLPEPEKEEEEEGEKKKNEGEEEGEGKAKVQDGEDATSLSQQPPVKKAAQDSESVAPMDVSASSANALQ